MRIIFLILFSTLIISQAGAQAFVPGNYPYSSFGGGFQSGFRNLSNFGDTLSTKKWSLNKYSGITTSFSVWKGGSASMIAAPVGLQLNRRLNNNFYAFAGVSAAPAYINFRPASMGADLNNKAFQGNSLMYRFGSLGVYSRAELGLMYTNDERTFQISGSFGVERRQFPGAYDFQRMNNTINKPAIAR